MIDSKKSLIIRKIEEWGTILFFGSAIFVLTFLVQALFLTWLNQFKIEYLLICLPTSGLLTIVFFSLIKSNIKLIPHLNIGVFVVVLLVSLVMMFFPHDTLGGRDEGNYAGQAVILSKYHGISVPSYLLKTPLAYGSPGQSVIFNETTPTYVVWLATQKVFFGIEWMLRSNVVLVGLGLCSLFLVSSLISKRSLAFATVLLFSTCMPFLWFARETMTENLALFLLWFLILSLFLFIKTKQTYFLIGLFLSSWLFAFTRNEGLFIQIPVLLVLITILLVKKIVSRRKILFISMIYTGVIFVSFLVNNNLNPLSENTNVSATLTQLISHAYRGNYLSLGEKLPAFTFQMLSKQNLSLAIYSFIFVMILIIARRKDVVKDKILYIGLLGIISVEFLKIINPSATPEQPWMYRRYLYALLPLGYLSLLILLNTFVKQKLLIVIFCAFLATNIVLSSRIITLKNNWSISGKIEELTRGITTDDFVIIDGFAIGNYYPLTYLAYHKEVRNLYKWWIGVEGWQPKVKKYHGLPYSRLFYLSDNGNATYQDFKLNKVNEVKIFSKQLQSNCELRSFGRELGLNIDDLARLPYLDVVEYCSKTNNDISEIDKIIYFYEMEYDY